MHCRLTKNDKYLTMYIFRKYYVKLKLHFWLLPDENETKPLKFQFGTFCLCLSEYSGSSTHL